MLQTNRTNTILYCRQWIETVAFYRDLLKLPVSFENKWFVEFQQTPSSFLSIANAANASIEPVNGQGITLSWQVSDLDQIVAQLEPLGVATTNIQQKWDARLCYLHDPEGHRIELWQPFDGHHALPDRS